MQSTRSRVAVAIGECHERTNLKTYFDSLHATGEDEADDDDDGDEFDSDNTGLA